MLQLVTALLPRWIRAAALLLGALALAAPAQAQLNPAAPGVPGTPGAPGAPAAPGQPGAQLNPICPRLEAQLASIDRGGLDPAKEDQIRRYQDAATRQQAELDRVTMQARRMGCNSTGFFSLFNGQSAQCGPVNNQIQQMRANLDQITGSLEQLRGGGFGGAERENQRRSVLVALSQNNCGPQYAAAAPPPQGPGGFLNNLFGGNPAGPPGGVPGAPIDMGSASGTYRTVCVRSCDGAYFPISFATAPARFADDEKTCKALCPAAEATLFVYRNPGEDMSSAVSTTGQPYTSLPNAFRFKSEFNPQCSCKAAGQTWQDALKSIDDKSAAESQGDIIVTEESAKKMQQRGVAKPAPVSGKKGAPSAAAPANPVVEAAPATPPAAGGPDNKPIRSVGPTFIPAK
jgi:hypothetical protein